MAAGQGDRLHRRGRLPRGARGGRDRPARACARRGGARRRPRSRAGRRRAALLAWPRRAHEASARYDIRSVRRAGWRPSTTRSSRSEALPEPRARRLRDVVRRSRATCSSAAIRPSSPAGPLPRGDVPVFVFHSLEPESFGGKLAHLADNGYVTLSADEYFAAPDGHARRAPERAVVLTFDDGRGSLWTRRPAADEAVRDEGRGLPGPRPHALAPGAAPSHLGRRWRRARRPRAVVRDRETGEGAFLSWEEIEALARAGSSSSRATPSPTAASTWRPRWPDSSRRRCATGTRPWTCPCSTRTAGTCYAAEAPLGTPLLRSSPAHVGGPALLRGPGGPPRCVEAVAARGRGVLLPRRLARRLLRGRPERAGRRPVRDARGARGRDPPRAAGVQAHPRGAHRTRGRPPLLPLARLGTDRAAAGRGGRLPHRVPGQGAGTPITRKGGDLRSVARIGEDYVELLPGQGRSSLAAVLASKWRRRLRGRA